MTNSMDAVYDAVIIGGSAAGLSAAVALGRARRSVLVVDAGEPRNAPADAVHNFYTRDGTNPLEMVRAGRAEASVYGVQFLDGRAVSAAKADGDADAEADGDADAGADAETDGEADGVAGRITGFDIALADGSVVRGRRLLVATGLVDELPDIPGLRALWGKDVIHCPYCHGWEVRDQKIGVLAAGPMSMHQALLFRQWSDDVTLFTRDLMEPTEEEYEQLAARGIAVVLGEVVSVDTSNAALTGVTTADGRTHPLQAIVVGPKFVARAEVLLSLGLEPVDHPFGAAVGSYIESGPQGATSIPGVWVAGNVTDLMAQVVTSAGAGLMAGAAINADLMAEELAAAVADYRAGARTDGTATITIPATTTEETAA